PSRRTGAPPGKAGEALFLAPGLFEMFVWQDVSRDWLGRPRPIDAHLQAYAALPGAAQGSRDPFDLAAFPIDREGPREDNADEGPALDRQGAFVWTAGIRTVCPVERCPSG